MVNPIKATEAAAAVIEAGVPSALRQTLARAAFDFVHDIPGPHLSRQLNELISGDLRKTFGGDIFGYLSKKPEHAEKAISMVLDDLKSEEVVHAARGNLTTLINVLETTHGLRKQILGQSDNELIEVRTALLKAYRQTDRFSAARDTYRSTYSVMFNRVSSVAPDVRNPDYLRDVGTLVEARTGLFAPNDPFVRRTLPEIKEFYGKLSRSFYEASEAAKAANNSTAERKIAENFWQIFDMTRHIDPRKPSFVRHLEVDGQQYAVGNNGNSSWFSSLRTGPRMSGATKIHVLTSAGQDAATLKAVLPFLHQEIEAGAISDFKTHFNHSMTGQSAKAIVVYPQPERISEVALKLDHLLHSKGLVRAAMPSGNLTDNYIVNGAIGSRRVGIIRDFWPGAKAVSRSSDGTMAAHYLRLDEPIKQSILRAYPSIETNPDMLKHLEKQLELQTGSIKADKVRGINWRILEDDSRADFSGSMGYANEAHYDDSNGRAALYRTYSFFGKDPVKSWYELAGQITSYPRLERAAKAI